MARSGRGDVEDAIREKTLELMGSTPLHRIRVTRLCAAAGVNRSTFYDHFRDVYDVVESLERQLLGELDDLSDEVRAGGLTEVEVCLAFLRFFSERRVVARALLASERGGSVRRELEARTTKLFAQTAARAYDLASDGAADALRFVSAGFYRFYDDVIMGERPLGENELRERAELGAHISSTGLKGCFGRART